jgi:hypothetical protein
VLRRERVDDPRLPSRAELEALMEEHRQFEADAVHRGQLSVCELCALWFLPGLTELPLSTGRAPIRVDWRRFPTRRRHRIVGEP